MAFNQYLLFNNGAKRISQMIEWRQILLLHTLSTSCSHHCTDNFFFLAKWISLLYYIKLKSISFYCSERLILCHIFIRDYYFIVLRKLPLLFRYTFEEGEMQCTYSVTLGAFWERSLGWKMRFLFDICVFSIWFQWFGLIYFFLLYRHLQY